MSTNQGWRIYQKKLQREQLKARVRQRGFWLVTLSLLAVLGLQFFRAKVPFGWLGVRSNTSDQLSHQTRESDLFGQKALSSLIDTQALINSPDGRIHFTYCGKPFFLESTIDPGLQGYMSKKIHTARSPLIGFVAMQPTSGKILAMVDARNIDGMDDNICLSSQFPAASLFKIISATAAIERCGLSASSTITYNGQGHTLYKNQLTTRTNRYTNSLSLEDAFAKSINPVFGKLGTFFLKKDLLQEYALRFGFNQPLHCALPVQPSRFVIDDDPYHWAEVACGFNRKTRVSPVHGAIIASAVVNGGTLVEPRIVKRITDSDKVCVYTSPTATSRQIMTPRTCRELMHMMGATIRRGTGRRAFKGYRRDRTLSKLRIGGKTGSIKNDTDAWLYDWFVGYGAQKHGNKQLALAILVVHDKLLRARAQEYARMALTYYFQQS